MPKGAYLTQQEIQNPDASIPLIIPVLVMNNTPMVRIEQNVRTNSALDREWLCGVDAHDGVAVLVGGGPSAADDIEEIRALHSAGAKVFAMNAASRWLRGHGIMPDYQVMVDAQPHSLSLVDRDARAHLFASQVDPSVMSAVDDAIVWHLGMDEIEEWFPPERVKRGGYALVGGGAAVGNCAMCVVFTMGYRDFHVFGFDSSNRDGKTHAYSQWQNRFIPNVDVEWGGKTYNASVAMKGQAEWFQIVARELVNQGSKIKVYGDGLLPAMWNAKPENMTERDKYRTLWQFDTYRIYSPGEELVPVAAANFTAPGPVIDFGCGTGRAALALKDAGFDVLLVDFASNCRDEEAADLPFIEWDLSRKGLPYRAPYGICSDVMEHIPADQVSSVVHTIMSSAGKVAFQISTTPDAFGGMIGTPLHLSVHDASWWRALFVRLGYAVEWEWSDHSMARFIVSRH
jgi:hypothetical protein